MREVDMVKKYHELEALLEDKKSEEKRYLVSKDYRGRFNLERFYCSLLDELEPGEVLTERDLKWLIEAYYARKEEGDCGGWVFNEESKSFENNCIYNDLSYGYKYITFVEAGRSLEEVAGIIAKWLWENRDKEFEVYYTDEIGWEISGEVSGEYYGETYYHLEDNGWFYELFRVEGVPPFNYQSYSKPRFVPDRKYICKLKKTEKGKKITYQRLEEKVSLLLEKTLTEFGFARYEGFYKLETEYSVWGWVLEKGWKLYESENKIELYRKWAGHYRQKESSLVIRIKE